MDRGNYASFNFLIECLPARSFFVRFITKKKENVKKKKRIGEVLVPFVLVRSRIVAHRLSRLVTIRLVAMNLHSLARIGGGLMGIRVAG